MTLVGVREAARQLGVHPSTVSRKVQDGRIRNHGGEGRPLVDVEEARRGDLTPGTSAAAPEGATTEETLMRARAAQAGVQARLGMLDLKKRTGQLLERAEVEAALATHAERLRDGLLGLGQRIAGELAEMDDAGLIRARLRAEHERLLNGFCAAFAAEAAGVEGADAA